VALDSARSAARLEAAETVKLCSEAGYADLAAGLISAGATLDAVKARLADAGDVAAICKLAGRPDLARQFVLENRKPGEIARQLQTAAAARGSATELQPEFGGGAVATPSADAEWERIVAKVNDASGFTANGKRRAS
jgi:hypothetical protein